MIIKTETLKKLTSKISQALDLSIEKISEVVELTVQNQVFYINVTNKEYFVTGHIDLGFDDTLNATVIASTFFNLISQTTSEDIEFRSDENTLYIKGNGNYKLPIICDNDLIPSLHKIVIPDPYVNMTIDSSILWDILKYNSRELQKVVAGNPLQRMYYIDENGAITFTSGACINKFKLEKPVRMLLSQKLVKLFKLLTGPIDFTLGYEALSKDIIQTKVRFQDDFITISSILSCDDTMLNNVPLSRILERVDKEYPYEVELDKTSLLQSINRLLSLEEKVKTGIKYFLFKFRNNSLILSDKRENNVEEIPYVKEVLELTVEYIGKFDLMDFKAVISTCEEPYIKLRFGDTQALVIDRNNIQNVIPEITL